VSDVTGRYIGRARKPHRCEECRRTIRAGETYYRLAFFGEGTASSAALCVRCDMVTDAAMEYVCCSGMNPDDWPEIGHAVPWLLDALDMPDVLALLSPEAAGHFCGLVFAMREKAAETSARRGRVAIVERL
jgi:hypothetical protein